jgi:succinate-semialdehyde dehydrogenase / glutarate-semialdehyde dehydrogenase
MSVTSDQISRVLSTVPKDLLIGGEWVRTATTLRVEDPATGKSLATAADAGPEEGRAALDAAVEAQSAWAATEPRERAEILRRAFELITERSEEIALLITLEMGKPLSESRAEVAYGAEFFRWFSEEAVRIAGRYAVAPTGGTRLLTMKQPVGPVFAITPWNLPLAMATRKLGPAFAAGCTVVLKPAEQTPLTALYLAAVMIECGLPYGVLNVISTSRPAAVSEPIIADPRLRKLTFTGSTEVGRRLIELSARQVLKVSMELGGNAPLLVFADADLDVAVDGAVLAKMRVNGEACTAANRILVHESIAEDFARRLAVRLGNMTIGRGIDDGVEVGPLVDRDTIDKVEALVDDAAGKGARVLTGGTVLDRPGYFYPPTVLADVPTSARMFSDEIFGPVAPITTFDTDEAAVAMANDTEFGLVSYLFTRDFSRALTVGEAMQSGMVGINQGIVSNPAAPFGGMKASGLGREGAAEGMEEYLETKYFGIRL